jgi:hypothetical protein
VRRRLLIAAALAAAFAAGGGALAAASFSDPVGDHHEAPDITGVEVSEANGLLTVRVTIANFQSLPPESFFNLWFDLDRNSRTGDDGDEANVNVQASGAVDFYRWDGRELLRSASTGMTGSFAAGVFTFTGPTAAFGAPGGFDLLVVSSRPQNEDEDVIAADFASEHSRLAYVAPGPMTFADPVGDEDAAPDVTAVDVQDTKDGWITIKATVANFQALPPDRAVLIGIDRDHNGATGDGGLDVFLTWLGGQRRVLLQRWDAKAEKWIDDAAPTRALGDSANGSVTVAIHRSELADVARFRFWLAAVDFTAEGESAFEDKDDVEAVDTAPEHGFWQYALTNKPPVHLVAGAVMSRPGRPVHGHRFAIRAPIQRTDTLTRVGAGKVSCAIRTRQGGGARLVRAVGHFRNGLAECTLTVPAKSAGQVLYGQMTVRALGARTVAKFAFAVR